MMEQHTHQKSVHKPGLQGWVTSDTWAQLRFPGSEHPFIVQLRQQLSLSYRASELSFQSGEQAQLLVNY